MYTFVDQHRTEFGVEPICRVLQIAPSAYRAYAQQECDATKRCARRQRDEQLRTTINATWRAHRCVYGARNVWKQLHRDGIIVVRCTVERLMHELGLEGVVRGAQRRTTVPDELAASPLDLVQRDFTATRPNQLWVADFTYVATWRGIMCVAFVIDVFARRIVGWRAHTTMQTP